MPAGIALLGGRQGARAGGRHEGGGLRRERRREHGNPERLETHDRLV